MGNIATRNERRCNSNGSKIENNKNLLGVVEAAAEEKENEEEDQVDYLLKTNITTDNSKSNRNRNRNNRNSFSEEAGEVKELRTTTAGTSSHKTTTSNFRKLSVWSFGSLSGRLNWSFTAASSSINSSISLPKFINRRHNSSKKTKKTTLQYSKTIWPVRYTDSIFLSHFQRFSRNEEFTVVHTIAKGAFGIVFKVQQKKNSNFEYALKILKKSKIIQENSVQQIKDEVEIQKLCGHHPFIVKQIDTWQNRTNLHILLEYIPHGELFTKITKFPYELVRVYVAELALAIDFLHNAGVIFRDVKPENILLTSSYHLKLTDFGLSKWLKLGERTKTMCGTLQYMAPEILRGENYGHTVDWWALGVVACRMLVNEYPYTTLCLQESNEDTIITSQEPKLNITVLPEECNSLPLAAKDLLNRLLEKDPKFRLRSVLGLQKIAMYKDFKINMQILQEISVIHILEKYSIPLEEGNFEENECERDKERVFEGF